MADNQSNSGEQTPTKALSDIGILYFNFIFKRWWIFLSIISLFGIGGYFYAKLQKPEYESRLTFALDAGADDALSGAMSLAAQFGLGFNSGQSMFDGDNILEIMKSRRIIEDVLLSSDTLNGKKSSMIDFYLEISGKRMMMAKKPYLKDLHFPPSAYKPSLNYRQDSILNNVYLEFSKNFINASRPDKKLSIYEVRVKSTNEEFAKKFTDKLINATSSFYTEITSRKDRETLEILEQRVASLKSSVSSSVQSRASVQDANQNPVFSSAQAPLLKEQYNMQAYGEAYKEMFKTLELARYQYLKKIPLLQIIDHADYPMKKTTQGKLKTGFIFSVLSGVFMLILFWVYFIFLNKKSRKTSNVVKHL